MKKIFTFLSRYFHLRMRFMAYALCLMPYALLLMPFLAQICAPVPAHASVAATPMSGTVFVQDPVTSSEFVSPYQYEMMRPFLNATMRAALDPGGAQALGKNPSAVMNRVVAASGNTPASQFVRNSASFNKGRRVVARGASINQIGMGVTAAPTTPTGMDNVARAAAMPGMAAMPTGNPGIAPSATRRVVARASRPDQNVGLRGDNNYAKMYQPGGGLATDSAAYQGTSVSNIPPERCMADYATCMDSYCHRPNTLYDRCYCSAKLAQIDAELQPAVADLMQKIQYLSTGGDLGMTEAELEEYWTKTFGTQIGQSPIENMTPDQQAALNYQPVGGGSSLSNLNNALNIDWSTTESRVRGQNAFATGHEYCVQNLQGCFYMASQMQGAYRSAMARDCQTYENYLRKLKATAETVIASYQE